MAEARAMATSEPGATALDGLRDAPTGCLVGGVWRDGPAPFAVAHKYHLDALAEVAGADAALVAEAVDRAVAAFDAGLPDAYARSEILLGVRDAVAARRALFRELMVAEAGFPLGDAAGEIDRALQTLALSAEETKRLGGEVVPFDGAPGGAGRIGFTLRVPLGLVAAITPFNAPLNTVAHKIGPAFAAGNAVLLKPSDKTPLTAALLAQCFVEAGAPAGALSVLQGGVPVAEALLADERVAFYAFTGSTAAGRAIQRAAGLRRTQMELGSIAATIVRADADLALAAAKCAGASFRKAGQVCTSIQLLLVEDAAHDAFLDAFLARVRTLRAGDPADPATDVGPMISEAAARRAEDLVRDAESAGARVLCGGTRAGAMLAPTVLADVPGHARARTEEIFGPVVVLGRVAGLDEAIATVNATPYGLATGVFTRDVASAFAAARRLKVGGVHVNETSSSRVDLMPYGGTKASGFGREGPAYAVREMSEARLVTFSGV